MNNSRRKAVRLDVRAALTHTLCWFRRQGDILVTSVVDDSSVHGS